MQQKKKTDRDVPDKTTLNVAVVGGGRTCKFFLELIASGSLKYLNINPVGVCDINPDAEGLKLAEQMGIYTTDNFLDLFEIKPLDGVIELTGSREVLLELIRRRPRGLGIIEHNIGAFLRDFFTKEQKLKYFEQEAAMEKMATSFLIQQANERISVLSPEFVILEANEAYAKAADKFKDDVIGAHCYEITHGLRAPCSSSHPELGCPMLETLRTGESAHVIHEHSLGCETPTYCDLVTYPVRDQNGKIVRIIEVCRDLTEVLSSTWEKRANALRADLKRLVQEDRMISLGKLVASSVHEINNPIQGLLTFSRLMQKILAEGALSPEDLEKFKEYLSLMTTELERCGDIVTGLLSFSRQSGKEYSVVEINEILTEVIALTHHKMELQGIKVNKDLVSSPLEVYGDVNQMQQCFLNLIFNATEAMPEGGTLTVTSKLDNLQNRAVVTIRDTGQGIAPENMDYIFDPFFTTKQEGEGTGLGLSIVHGIVKTHKGEIDVSSRVGEGTEFVLFFPIQEN